MGDCSAKLGLDVVTDNRDARVLEALCPCGVARYKDGHAIYEGHVCFHRTFGIEPDGIFGTDRQII